MTGWPKPMGMMSWSLLPKMIVSGPGIMNTFHLVKVLPGYIYRDKHRHTLVWQIKGFLETKVSMLYGTWTVKGIAAIMQYLVVCRGQYHCHEWSGRPAHLQPQLSQSWLQTIRVLHSLSTTNYQTYSHEDLRAARPLTLLCLSHSAVMLKSQRHIWSISCEH